MSEIRPTFLALEGVGHIFPDGIEALRNVSFQVPAGAFMTLVGPSGIGKSTLLRIIAGLLEPTVGKVWLDGQEAAATPEPIGLVFQKDNLMPWRTAYDNVRLPLELWGQNGPEAKRRVLEMLELVGLAGFEQSYPAQLSGGMAQRVALARALIHQPRLLLLDEPFGALDAFTRERMGQELLRIWTAWPVTVFMVPHSITEAVFLADEVVVMNGQPGTLTDRIPIDLPRPRNLTIEATAEFQQLAAAVRQAIKN